MLIKDVNVGLQFCISRNSIQHKFKPKLIDASFAGRSMRKIQNYLYNLPPLIQYCQFLYAAVQFERNLKIGNHFHESSIAVLM